MAKHTEIGKIGEDIAVRFLGKQGFSLIEKNYRKKFGELDIVAKKDNRLKFIEVKSTASLPTKDGVDAHRPEDHVHAQKLIRMRRAIEVYISERKIPKESRWTVDLLVIFLDEELKKAKVRVVEDILSS